MRHQQLELMFSVLISENPVARESITPIANRRRVLASKPFLRNLYRSWYKQIISQLDRNRTQVLEIGTGPGFLKDFLPTLIRSDILRDQDIDLVLDGAALPLQPSSLDAVVGINVYHHVVFPNRFLRECARVVRPRGKIILLEPWNTPWSTLCFRLFHQEPFDPGMAWSSHNEWAMREPNNALAWITFCRELKTFVQAFPSLDPVAIRLITPFAYLLSGGINRSWSIPGVSFSLVHRLESLMQPLFPYCAMFALIVLSVASTSDRR